jgi:hypothetical protein
MKLLVIEISSGSHYAIPLGSKSAVTKFMIALKVGMKQYETFIRLESKGF